MARFLERGIGVVPKFDRSAVLVCFARLRALQFGGGDRVVGHTQGRVERVDASELAAISGGPGAMTGEESAFKIT